jgi:hypothetical protein
MIHLFRSSVEHDSFLVFLSRFREVSTQYRLCPISVVFTAWTDYVAKTCSKPSLIDCHGTQWLSLSWYHHDRFTDFSIVLQLADREAHLRREQQQRDGFQKNQRQQFRDRSRWDDSSSAEHDRGGNNRSNHKYKRGDRGDVRGDARGDNGRDAKGSVQQQSGSTAAVSSTQSSASASSGAAPIIPAAGAFLSGTNVGWCHNGPDCTRHKAGQCRYKH